MVVKSTDSSTRLLGLKHWIFHLLVVYLGQVTLSLLHFFFYEVEILTSYLPPSVIARGKMSEVMCSTGWQGLTQSSASEC